jgi:DNA-binding SARP family transcriptional activator
VLLLHANEPLTTDRLIDDLWGEHPPPTAAKAVHVHVSRLPKALAVGAGNGGAGGDPLVTVDAIASTDSRTARQT